jgi:hypothetical protein
MKPIINWLLYTSIFAGCCAVSLSVGTEWLILSRLPPLFSYLHAFILGATMMVYNAHFMLERSLPEISDRLRWSKKHIYWHYIIFFTGLFLCSVSIFHLSWKILIACVILGMLSFTYTLPLLPLRIRLREFGWIKILTLTLVWTIVTSVLPILYWGRSILDFPFEIMIRFAFLFILCIAFDLRDMQTDLKANIYTLPNLIGIKRSYQLIDYSIILFIVLSIIQYARYPFAGRLLAEIAVAIATKAAIWYSKKHPSDSVYLGIVDGVMLLYGCLIAFFSHYK